ncbi:hypothetical protein LCGC14_0624370 [marine sediment metagenome]|uniref:Uncharacterized protein n=1 Tax=marine sediment metagenome TaxID=412755 RepID=A0A0F9TQD1_9ZZZZ
MFIDEVAAKIQATERHVQELEASKRMSLAIKDISSTRQWEPLQALLEEKRQLAMLRMCGMNVDDRTRGDLAAEVRVLGWLAEQPLAAARDVPAMEQQIKMCREEINALSRRVPQKRPQ